MNLYDYQQKVVDDVDAKIAAGIRRLLITAPTGSGKTVIAAALIKLMAAASKRALVIAHRDELITQARDKLRQFADIFAGVIKAGRDKELRPQSLVQVASVQTLHARAFRSKTTELPPAEVVIVDEAHHVRARTYQQIIDAYPDAVIIGLTATPCRGDGRGLGNVFDALIEAPQVAELIKLEKLVPPRFFTVASPDLRGVGTAATGDYVVSQLSERVNSDVLVGDVVGHWLRHAERRRTVLFAVDIAHSVHLTQEFVKSEVKAEHLDGNTPQAERDAILARLASVETEVVCNCAVLTEGFDCPDIGCIVLARPTKSLLLYLQMIGRGLRTEPDKKDCIILDHAGAVNRHGKPDDRIEWTLETDERAANKTHEARKSEHKEPFVECPRCKEMRLRGLGCDACGWQPKPRAEAIDYIDDDLVELGKAATVPTYGDKAIFHAELRGYQHTARKKDGSPYANGWAAHKFKERFGHYPPWDWNDKPALEPTMATLRWIKSRQIAFAKARAA
jgi:DNA repair protein RadD